jgi:hypothetical protein
MIASPGELAQTGIEREPLAPGKVEERAIRVEQDELELALRRAAHGAPR